MRPRPHQLSVQTFDLRRTIAAAGMAFTALVLALAFAPPAHAGTYEVWSCRLPDGAPAPTDGWTFSIRGLDPAVVVPADGCASGGAIELALPDETAFGDGARASVAFAAPPGTTIAEYTVWRALHAAGGFPLMPYYYVSAVRERTATADVDHGCASVLALPNFNCSTSGSFTDPDDPGNRFDGRGAHLRGVELWVGCGRAGGCVAPFAPPTARARLYGARVELQDLAAPEPPQLSGSLADGAPVGDVATLVVESADAGGGIAATTLSIDGGAPRTIAPAGPRETCRTPYTTPVPCPAAAARAFAVDTAELAEGAHVATGTVVDAAGNATPYGPIPFTVEHRDRGDGDGDRQPPPVVPTPPVVPAPPAQPTPAPAAPDTPQGNGVPAVRRPRLRLDRARVRRTPRGAVVTGALRTPVGAPIVGARLTVGVQELGDLDGRERRLAPVVTTRGGRFSVRVRADGPVRVTIAFAPGEEAADTAVATATVEGRARLGIARSDARLRRGQRLTLHGRLTGAGAAGRGALVEVQAIVRGDWRAVGTVETDARGRWRWPYRFVNVTRDTIFSFRAVVHRTPGWPLPAQVSRRVQVRVDAEPAR